MNESSPAPLGMSGPLAPAATVAAGVATREPGAAARSSRGEPRMASVVQDIRSTFRAMRRWPAGYAVIVLTLALGIGINTMFFTFFNGMVLRPLPFVDPAQLVTLN